MGRIIIAGTHSGCGKTTITMGIIRALSEKGFKVIPWKTGPDYIDPGFHSAASGYKCRNLDTMMLEKDTVLELLERQDSSADISVIEGVMGLYDSASADDERGSAAHLAKMTNTPVILVIDAKAMARSAAAIALGFRNYDKEVPLAGFIFNRTGSERHYEILKESVEKAVNLPVIGHIKKNPELSIAERHLGLIPAWEKEKTEETIIKAADAVKESINLDLFTDIAQGAGRLPPFKSKLFGGAKLQVEEKPKVKIAAALDDAFCFYYDDNFDLLRYYGAEIEYFSPLKDRQLPENTDALYLGGGYPELFAEKLSANKELINQIREKAQNGMPVLGECGGFMYLCSSITDTDDRNYPMCALLPGRTVMGKKLRSLGYCTSVNNTKNILGPEGTEIKGHMFHWAVLENVPEKTEKAFTIIKGNKKEKGGLINKRVLGSWVHFHFASNASAAENFVLSALEYKKEKERN